MLGDYGEVLVLDWGIAKLTGEPEGAAAGTDTVDASVNVPLRPATRSGSVTGTAGYMSPEQARGDAIGPQSDVFALGAVLFEILCNRPPFADREDPTVVGTATPGSAALSSKLTFPESPAVPAELKSICVRALSWDASARYANAGAFTEDLVAWLEGSKNLVRAEELLADALAEHERMDQLRREAVTLRAQASQILEAVPAFVPVAVKLPAWDLQDRAASMDKEADACSVRFRQAVWSALTFHADLPGAHRRLADHYAVEHARAETSGLSDEAAKLEVLLRDHDRGGHTSYLAGEGVFSLATDPPGATAELHRYVVRDRRLQLEKVGNLGTTPLERVSLPMGSYMVILSAEGRQTVRYPVQIRRLEFWDGVPPEGGSTAPVYLPREGELDADEIYVPAGWFWSGGSDVAIGRRSVMPRRRLWMDGFAIRRHQVTIGEYVDFLNNLVRQGRQQEASPVAPRVAGRQGELGALLLDQNPDGTYFIPANNYFGTPWHPDWPSVFVDWYGATAYAREKAARSGKRFRLPTEFEWEKAARGVDARRFPWGDFLDPTWCRMLETHAGFPTPSPAGTDEVDESPYGARDMAGNQRDWCMDVPSEQGPPVSAEGRVIGYLDSHEAWNVRVARGGNFLDSQLWCWSYHRSSFLPHVREYIISFRTARSIAGAEPQAIGMRPPSPPPAG
jgi:serine/threonine-protein kinase